MYNEMFVSTRTDSFTFVVNIYEELKETANKSCIVSVTV